MNRQDSLTRRRLLGRAARGMALVSAMRSVAPAIAQQSSTSPLPRIRESFDFDWKFLKGDSQGAQEIQFPDSGWRNVDLPHDWSIEGPFSEKEPAQGSLPTGIAWYRKRFRVPNSYRDRTVRVEFDGVYQNSEVWINGKYLGKRPYGFIPFSYDLSANLNPGRDQLPVVFRLRDLPPYVALGDESASCRVLGHLRDVAAGVEGERHRSDQDDSQ